MIIKINETNFPDDNFRRYLTEIYGKSIETNAVQELNVNYCVIDSLKGIEFFTKLKILHCSYNNLIEIDLRGNPNLEKLYCQNNKLTYLDLEYNTKLRYLYCNDNKLTRLYLGYNLDLEYVKCFYNLLENIYISNNTKLVELDCSGNKLTEIIVNYNPKLKKLSCERNNFTELLLGGLTELITLTVDYALKETLDISKCSKLMLENVYFEK